MAVQVEPASPYELTSEDGELCIMYLVCKSSQLTTALLYVIVIHAYDVSLRASKEKEQQLQLQLSTVQQESQDRAKQLSKLEDDNYSLQKERLVLKHSNDLQQEELKRLQQTG